MSEGVRLAVASLALTLLACGGPPSSNFEGDDEFWTLSLNGDVTRPTLLGEGGSPGGHICGRDANDENAWYFVAPPKFTGDMSQFYGRLIVFQLKQGQSFNQVSGKDIVLSGNGLTLAYNYKQNNKGTPGRDWTAYRARLDDKSGWVIDQDNYGNGPPVNEEDMRSVLRRLESFRIRGEFYDGPNDTACLDSVVFGAD